MTTTLDVLAGRAQFAVECAEAIAWFDALPPLSLDLVCGSPPYCDARTYGIDAQRGCLEWVEWMLRVTEAAHRACKGPVIWVVAGVTRDRNYWPACEGLAWEWWKRGGDCQLYRPLIYRRVGIPGSGGDDWFRSDWEFVLAIKHAGPLPFADNTACGHPPRWAPGGAMSNRTVNGGRVNQWGMKGPAANKKSQVRGPDGTLRDSSRPSHYDANQPPPADPGGDDDDFWTGEPEEKEEDQFGMTGRVFGGVGDVARKEPRRSKKPATPRQPTGEGEEQGEEEFFTGEPEAEKGNRRCLTDEEQAALATLMEAEGLNRKQAAKRLGLGDKVDTNAQGVWKSNEVEGGTRCSSGLFVPPVLANPGTVIDPPQYTAREVAELLGCTSDVIDCSVGGNSMGSKLASENEAPYPEQLPERFIRSFAPPGGLVCDPFSGSGTTAAVALRWGRRCVCCDVRQSQVDLTRRRVDGETPYALFEEQP